MFRLFSQNPAPPSRHQRPTTPHFQRIRPFFTILTDGLLVDCFGKLSKAFQSFPINSKAFRSFQKDLKAFNLFPTN
jgi:hypothetical protein